MNAPDHFVPTDDDIRRQIRDGYRSTGAIDEELFERWLSAHDADLNERLDEAEEKLAIIAAGCVNLSREELVKQITAVGPARYKAGNWLGERVHAAYLAGRASRPPWTLGDAPGTILYVGTRRDMERWTKENVVHFADERGLHGKPGPIRVMLDDRGQLPAREERLAGRAIAIAEHMNSRSTPDEELPPTRPGPNEPAKCPTCGSDDKRYRFGTPCFNGWHGGWLSAPPALSPKLLQDGRSVAEELERQWPSSGHANVVRGLITALEAG